MTVGGNQSDRMKPTQSQGEPVEHINTCLIFTFILLLINPSVLKSIYRSNTCNYCDVNTTKGFYGIVTIQNMIDSILI